MGILILLKPNFGLSLFVILLLGHYHFFLYSALACIALGILSILAFGIRAHLDWAQALSSFPFPQVGTNASIFQLPGSIGSVVGVFLALAIIVFLFVRKKERGHPLPAACYLGLTLSLVFSPIAWVGYIIILWPFLIKRLSKTHVTAAMILLLFPADLMFSMSSELQLIRFMYPCALLLIASDALAVTVLPTLERKGSHPE